MRIDLDVRCRVDAFRRRGTRSPESFRLTVRIGHDLAEPPASEVAAGFVLRDRPQRPDREGFDIGDTVMHGGRCWMALHPGAPPAIGEPVPRILAAVMARVRGIDGVVDVAPHSAVCYDVSIENAAIVLDTRADAEREVRLALDNLMVHDGRLYVADVFPVYAVVPPLLRNEHRRKPEFHPAHAVVTDSVYATHPDRRPDAGYPLAFGPTDANGAVAALLRLDAPVDAPGEMTQIVPASPAAEAFDDSGLRGRHLVRGLLGHLQQDGLYPADKLAWLVRLGGPDLLRTALRLRGMLSGPPLDAAAFDGLARTFADVLSQRMFHDPHDAACAALDALADHLAAAPVPTGP